MIQELTVIYYMFIYLFVSLFLFAINYALIKINKIYFFHYIKLSKTNRILIDHQNKLIIDNKEEIDSLKRKLMLLAVGKK